MDLVRVAAGIAVLLTSVGSAAAAKPEDPNRRVCKSKPVVGSRLKRVRECHSAAEWEDMKLAEQVGLTTKQFNGFDGQGENEYKVRGGSTDPR